MKRPYILLAILGLPAVASADTVTLYQGQVVNSVTVSIDDTYIRSGLGQTDTNFGSQSLLAVESFGANPRLDTTLIAFKDMFAMLPKTVGGNTLTITSAQLNLTTTYGGYSPSDTFGITAARVTTNWLPAAAGANESVVTFDHASSGTPWAAGSFSSADYDTTTDVGTWNTSPGGVTSFDVTNMVNAMYGDNTNDGFALMNQIGQLGYYQLGAAFSPLVGPALVITYAYLPGGGPVNATWAASSTGNWSTGANWSGSTAPTTAGSTAIFDGTGVGIPVNVDVPEIVGTITFSGSTAYTISGSALTLDNTGGSGNASINSNTGIAQVISSQVVVANTNLDVNSTAGGALTLSGGIDNTAGLTVTLNATNNSSISTVGGTIINNGTLQVTGSGSTVTIGAITGAGSVVQTGNTLSITADSTYGGGTTVTNATLLANNGSGAANSATGSGSVTLNSATLGGHGTISGAVIIGTGSNTIAPSATLSAASTGTLSVGSLTTNANTTLAFNLVSAGVNDTINVTGSLDVSAGGGISLNDSSAPEGYYKILQYGSLTGSGLSVLTAAPNSKEAYIIDTHHDAGFIDIHKALIGDVDGSGLVDGADFDIWFTHLQTSTFSYEQGDLNGDGLVDGADFDIWFTHLQNSFGGFTQTQLNELAGFLSPAQLAGLGPAVPEPTSLALLGLGAMGLLARRRNRPGSR